MKDLKKETEVVNQKMVIRYAYKNTASSAGAGEKVSINVDDIVRVNVWVNYYGNPSYGYIMSNGDTYLMIDDYSALNGVANSVHRVNRKKDLV